MVRPAKILVVDDDPDFLDSVRTMLENNSYQVAVAPGEDEALGAMEAENPDLLILDVMMSKSSSGFQLMWELKADERYRAIPILIVTGVDRRVRFDFARHASAASRTPDEKAYLPVDGYIVKPVRTTELLRSVKRILERAGKQVASTR